MKRTFLSELLDFLFPPLCHLCRTHIPHADALHLCPACHADFIPVSSPCCTVCGIPFAGAGTDHICGDCCRNLPFFDTACAPYQYHGALKELLHTFKYDPKPHLRKPLSLLVSRQLPGYAALRNAEAIVPVPLHRTRLRQRGFNQAVLLAEVLSQQWHIPLERQMLQRNRWTEPQVHLSATERRSNVKGAFTANLPHNKAIGSLLLVDDVLTTGSTVDECSRVLKAAGVRAVHVVTVARAV